MNTPNISMVMIPEEEWHLFKEDQKEILSLLKQLQQNRKLTVPVNNITAKEFMAIVRIGRTKFDQLVLTNKIKVIKKRRKIYVPVTEIDRYFKDNSIP